MSASDGHCYYYAKSQPDYLLQPQSVGKRTRKKFTSNMSQNWSWNFPNFPNLLEKIIFTSNFPNFPTKVCLHTLAQSFTISSQTSHVKSGRQHPSPSNHQLGCNKTQRLLQIHQQIPEFIQKYIHFLEIPQMTFKLSWARDDPENLGLIKMVIFHLMLHNYSSSYGIIEWIFIMNSQLDRQIRAAANWWIINYLDE